MLRRVVRAALTVAVVLVVLLVAALPAAHLLDAVGDAGAARGTRLACLAAGIVLAADLLLLVLVLAGLAIREESAEQEDEFPAA